MPNLVKPTRKSILISGRYKLMMPFPSFMTAFSKHLFGFCNLASCLVYFTVTANTFIKCTCHEDQHFFQFVLKYFQSGKQSMNYINVSKWFKWKLRYTSLK